MCTVVIMRALAPLLLCLLSALVEVHSQTVPYVRFMDTTLPNHSYVNLSLVGRPEDDGDSVQCHTNLSTCCSGAEGDDRGDWYFPDGNRLPFNSEHVDIYEVREAQQVDLRRRNNGGISGIYRCDIETNAVNDEDGHETVYVGLYASGGEHIHVCGPLPESENYAMHCILYVIVIAWDQGFMAVNQPSPKGAARGARLVYVAINPWQPMQ